MRVKNMEDPQFQELVRAGYTTIVEDCVPLDSKLAGTGCAEYARRFPKEHMKAEYTPGQAHINLEKSDWYKTPKKTVEAPQHMSKGKTLSGPYVWHVKDETVGKNTKPELASQFHVPYFLNRSTLNRAEVLDSFEMWFTHEDGGTQAHADAYCETTISAQLSGQKTWRYGTFPNISNAFEPYQFHDGQIYEFDKYWQPEHEHFVKPGECIIFPMGLIHETYVRQGDGMGESCTVASTFQFQDPQPVYLWRNFMLRWGLSHYSMVEPCIGRMKPYIYLGGKVKKTGASDAAIQGELVAIFDKLDKSKDGVLDAKELHAPCKKRGLDSSWTAVKPGSATMKQAIKEKVGFCVQDMIRYHDVNSDGQVSKDEFLDSGVKFTAILERQRYIKELRKKKKAKELLEKEKEWIRKYLCSDDNCPYLRKLEQSFKKTKNGKIEL